MVAAAVRDGGILASAPGKVFLGGEWSILEPRTLAIVAAVERRLYISVEESPDGRTWCTDGKRWFCIDGVLAARTPCELEGGSRPYSGIARFLAAAAAVVRHSCREWRPCRIRLAGPDSAAEGRAKLGLGGSSAAVAAAVRGLREFQCLATAARGEIFKQASLAHLAAQDGQGSCADVAAAVAGGIVCYRRFDPSWYRGRSRCDLGTLTRSSWPDLDLRQQAFPATFGVKIGWTGAAASTTYLLRAVREWARLEQRLYRRCIGELASATVELSSALTEGAPSEVAACVRKLHGGMRRLSESSQAPIVTAPLETLVRIAEQEGAAAKASGAGGGDCGIAFAGTGCSSDALASRWKAAGIVPLPLELGSQGARLEHCFTGQCL